MTTTTTPEYKPSNGDSVILDSTTFGVVLAVTVDGLLCTLVTHGGAYCYGIVSNRLKPFNVTKAVEQYLKAEEEKGKQPKLAGGVVMFYDPPTFLEVLAKSAAELTAKGYYASAAVVLEVMSKEDANAQEAWIDGDDEDEEE